jgi:hypothetical protein
MADLLGFALSKAISAKPPTPATHGSITDAQNTKRNEMVQSRLVSAKQDIERELKRGVKDPRRKAYLTARLLQLERDIGVLGFSEDEIKRNNFVGAGGANTKQVGSDTYYVPLPTWNSSNN